MKLTKQEKKRHGIFFTPEPLAKDLVTTVMSFKTDVKSILEPSCGMGVFISLLEPQNIPITGIELNDKIISSLPNFSSNVRIYHMDFLTSSHSSKYDLIIGNPPYFVMKKSEVSKEFLPFIYGRPNIYTLFILKCLGLLNLNGLLAFVIPKNFLTCGYYDRIRRYISDNFRVLSISYSSHRFEQTEQETISIIIENDKPDKRFFHTQGDYLILAKENPKHFSQSTTLKELGFNISVGKVVWNQVKDELTDDSSFPRLIYSSDIKDLKLSDPSQNKNEEKKNYIRRKGLEEKAILIQRGYGNAKYNFKYCMIDGKTPYEVENHVIMISQGKSTVPMEDIIKSFSDQRTSDFINTYLSNNAINVSELSNVLPIFL